MISWTECARDGGQEIERRNSRGVMGGKDAGAGVGG